MNIEEYISSGIIEMYVMGLCSADEKLELETLKKNHPELQKAIFQYELEMEKQMMQSTLYPSVETDEKILHNLNKLGERPLQNAAINTPVKKLFRLQAAAAAAILLLAISSVINFTLFNKTKRLELALNEVAKKESFATLPVADYNIMKSPTITPVAMYGVGLHAICRCTMFWDKSTGKIYIMIHHLPVSSATKDYQLWATVNGKQINVGKIQDEIRGRFIEMPNVPAGADAFIVTLEKAGDDVTPTLDETYLSGRI